MTGFAALLADRLTDRATTLETAPKPWRELARPEQLAPDGAWLTWIYMAGRGAGKIAGRCRVGA